MFEETIQEEKVKKEDDSKTLEKLHRRMLTLQIKSRGIYESGEFIGNKCWKSTPLHELYEVGQTAINGTSTLEHPPPYSTSFSSYPLQSNESPSSGLSDLQRLRTKRSSRQADSVDQHNRSDVLTCNRVSTSQLYSQNTSTLYDQNLRTSSCLRTPPPTYVGLGPSEQQASTNKVLLVQDSTSIPVTNGMIYTEFDLEKCSNDIFSGQTPSGLSSGYATVPSDETYSSCSLESLLGVSHTENYEPLREPDAPQASVSKRRPTARSRKAKKSVALLFNPNTMSSKHFWEAHKEFTATPPSELKASFFEFIRRSSGDPDGCDASRQRAAYSRLAGLANALLFRQRACIWELPKWRDNNGNNLLEAAVHARNANAVSLLLQEGFIGLSACLDEPPLLVQVALKAIGEVTELNWESKNWETNLRHRKQEDAGQTKLSAEQEMLLHFLKHVEELRGTKQHAKLLNGLNRIENSGPRSIMHRLLDEHSHSNDLSWSVHQLAKAGSDLFIKVKNSDGRLVDCLQRAVNSEDVSRLLPILLHGMLWSVKLDGFAWTSEQLLQGRYTLESLRRALEKGHFKLDKERRKTCLELINALLLARE